MSLFKYIERIKAIHFYIEKAGTGTGEEFAERLQISRSMLMEHIKELRECYDAPIAFCRKRRTFYYSKPFRLSVTIKTEMDHVVGGACSLSPEILLDEVNFSGMQVDSMRITYAPQEVSGATLGFKSPFSRNTF